MQNDGAAILMHMGHDFDALMHPTPQRRFRFDPFGWLGLSGEPNCADLNVAAIVRGAPQTLFDDYLREIASRDLSAILFVDPAAEEITAAAIEAKLTPAGTVPVMLRHAAAISPIPRAFTVRQATYADINVANDLLAEAFSLDRSAVQHVFSSTQLDNGGDIWLVEDAGVMMGCGTFVRGGDSVGIYSMSTPARQQGRGIGRAVLEHGMRHYQSQGVTTFTLEATAQGLHLYEQVGFRTVMEAAVFVIGVSTQFAAS